MNGESIKSAFEGVDDEYKQILARDNKGMLSECISEINKTIKSTDALTPSPNNIFNAFRQCGWNNLRVIIIGQDPYPTPGDAMGLSFSVNKGVALPQSLKNIYMALNASGFINNEAPVNHGDLSSWGKQGVLMLNMALTTVKNQRAAHMKIWKPYVEKILTDIALKCSIENKPLVFILWGGFAKEVSKIVDKVNFVAIHNDPKLTIHRTLEWGHPSPVSRFNQRDPAIEKKHFANCDNFTKCNEILKENNLEPINWNPDANPDANPNAM